MNKLQDKKQIGRLTLLFALTYMVSYLTRINYGAVISEMVTDTGFSRSLLSMAVTGSFITYGLGQIVSGIVGDHFSPKKLVGMGLLLSAAMNVLIPLCRDPWQMTAVWCVNGFAQSLMWPPMVRLMITQLTAEDYKIVTTKVIWGSSIGTILVYLIAPVLIELLSWQAVFYVCGGCGLVMLVLWQCFAADIPVQKRPVEDKESKRERPVAMLFTPVMLALMLAIIMMGMLRDGVTTWMPSYIADTYNLSNAVSILTGVILPIFTLVCTTLSTRIYAKAIRNPVTCGMLFFAIGAVCALGLYLLTGKNAGASVVFSAGLTGCMHGVNMMLICMLPAFFEKYGIVSTASGVLNACTYVGSAISTYGVALLSEQMGWKATLLLWLGVAVLATVLCLVCIKPFHKKYS